MQQIDAENNDRADILEKTLDQHIENQTQKLTAIMQKHQMQGRDSLAKATEGRIKALKDKVDRKRLQIQDARTIKHDLTEVCIGIIQMY